MKIKIMTRILCSALLTQLVCYLTSFIHSPTFIGAKLLEWCTGATPAAQETCG